MKTILWAAAVLLMTATTANTDVPVAPENPSLDEVNRHHVAPVE